MTQLFSSAYKSHMYTPPRLSHSRNAPPTTDVKPFSVSTYSMAPTQASFSGSNSASAAFRESKLNDLHDRYEQKAQDAHKKYVHHYNEQVTISNTVVELQNDLNVSHRKIEDLSIKVNDLFRALEQEKRAKVDVDRENKDLREKLRRKDASLMDYETKVANVQQNATSVSYENDSWKLEVKKLSETYSGKLKLVEEKYQEQVKELTEEIDSMRSTIKEREIDNESKIRGVMRELEAKVRSLENQQREKERILAESESEIRSLKEFNMKTKMEFEEEIRKQTGIVREDERDRYEGKIRELQGKIKEIESGRELPQKKIGELMQEVKNKEKLAKDIKGAAEDQINKLRRQITDLQDKISMDGSEVERLHVELRGKDSVIVKLQGELHKMQDEIMRQKDVHAQETNRLAVRNDADVRKFQDWERQLKGRIADLEEQVRVSEAEAGKLRTDLEKLRQAVTGSIERTITETFSDYEVRTSIRKGGR